MTKRETVFVYMVMGLALAAAALADAVLAFMGELRPDRECRGGIRSPGAAPARSLLWCRGGPGSSAACSP